MCVPERANASLFRRLAYAELQGRITTAEGEASSILPSIDSIREQLMAIEERKSKILADIGRMKAAKDTSAASLHALTQQIAAIKHAQQTLLADHTSAVPRVKYVACVSSK